MKSSVLKVLGGSLLTFAIIWGLVLAWWQSNDYEPSRVDLALYLGALPFALVGGYLLLRGFIEHLKAPPPVAPAASAEVIDDDPLAGSKALTAEAERTFSLCLVDALMCVPGGLSADDVLAAIEAGKRPQPNARLTDDSGFPVFLAEVEGLEVDEMAGKLHEEGGAMQRLADRESVLRALVMLDQVMVQARDALLGILGAEFGKSRIQILWLVPANWGQESFPDLRRWFQENYCGGIDKAVLEISLLPVVHEADALQQVDQVILRANRAPSDDEVFLLVGAMSAVDEYSVERWAASNQLFSAKFQERKIPGEGAVALLLTTSAVAAKLALSDVALVSRVSHGVRDKPVDAGGRISGRLIEQLIGGLLEVAKVEHSAIETVVFDADHRSGHITEAMEGLGQAFDHLDPIRDCLATGTVNGAIPPLGSLVALAAARARLLSSAAPVLCMSTQHETERAVMLLSLPVVPDIPEPSPT